MGILVLACVREQRLQQIAQAKAKIEAMAAEC